jgi:hypothetical protein
MWIMWNLDANLLGANLGLYMVCKIVLILMLISLVTWIMWNLSYFHLQIVLVLVQDRYMVCARYAIGLEIILDAPDGTTG